MEYEDIKSLYESKGLKLGVVYRIEPISIRTSSYNNNREVVSRVVFDGVENSEERCAGMCFYREDDIALADPGYMLFSDKQGEYCVIDNLVYGYLKIGELDKLLKRLNPVLDKQYYNDKIRWLEQQIEVCKGIIS